MAHRVGSLRRTDSVAIEGIADIRRSLAARRSDANDPTRTFAATHRKTAAPPECYGHLMPCSWAWGWTHMRRREFLGMLGAGAAWPLTARAQQAGKLPTIGFLGTASASAWGPWTAAFVQRLRALDWIEGRTVAIEYRWAAGR